MSGFKLFCLGWPILELDGQPVKLEMRKSLALLVYLRMSRLDYSRERLATLFWPEYDQRRALANLRRVLSSLNASLGINLLEADREKIGLRDQTLVCLDVEEFHECLNNIKTHPHPESENCPECLSFLETAVRLYRGDFLEGFNLKDCPDFDEWQLLQRESLRQEFAWVLQTVAERCARQSDWEPAIAYARRWVALDRLNEPAQRNLISLYARVGQRVTAMKQYEDLAQTLMKELGQSPENDTVALYRKIQEAGATPARVEPKTIPGEKAPQMGEPLLKTKLHIPFSRGNRVRRERLVSRLNGIEEHALTILSAPAGYGKTTAVIEWVLSSSLPVGWVSLDHEDNDPARFLSYLAAALDSIEGGIGVDAQVFLHSAHSLPLAVVLASLIHNLEIIPYPFVLVLDDYQVIESQMIHQAVAFLLDHLPINMHLLIITRADPPFPLARLRSQEQLLEIRTHDLHFTLDEANNYLNQVMNLGLSATDVAALVERTEGWIVGLKMAAIALQLQPSRQKPEETAEFMRAFSGSNRYILDYLVEEVLNRQPAAIKDFLLKTSILESLSGQLCDAVLGEIGKEILDQQSPVLNPPSPYTNSQQILEQLERANLFVVPLDNERLWYRYHHLFASLLSNRLSQSLPPELIRDMHRRASQWFEQNNLSDKAMHHALFTRDYESATRIIEQNAFQMIGRGEIITLMNWIARLPGELVDKSRGLSRFKMWGLGFAGQIQQAEQCFSKIEAVLEGQPQSVEAQTIRGEIALFRGVAANYRCEFQEAIDQSRRALALIPVASPRIRAVAVFVLGDVYRAQGDLEHSSNEFIEAGRMAFEFDEFWTEIQSLWSQAVVSEIQGQLHKAEGLYKQAYQIASSQGLQPGSVTMVDVGMSGLLYEWNQLDRAKRLLNNSVENISWPGTMHWWETPNMIVPGYLVLARQLKITGDMKAAKATIERAVRLCKEFDVFPDIYSQVQAELVRFWLDQGKITEAAEWLEKYQVNESDTLEVWHEPEDIACIRVLISSGRIAAAQSRLARLKGSAEDGGRFRRLIEILILQALTFRLMRYSPEALDVLQRALTLSKAEGYIRIFLDEGAQMQALLQLSHAEFVHEYESGNGEAAALAEYTAMLLEAFQQEKL